MRRIASRVAQLNGEGALAVYSRAKELEREGRSIIHLELGEPDFHPAAPVWMRCAMPLRPGGIDTCPREAFLLCGKRLRNI
jgi:aspartate aminotransferase